VWANIHTKKIVVWAKCLGLNMHGKSQGPPVKRYPCQPARCDRHLSKCIRENQQELIGKSKKCLFSIVINEERLSILVEGNQVKGEGDQFFLFKTDPVHNQDHLPKESFGVIARL
jgi:hypothetical protein